MQCVKVTTLLTVLRQDIDIFVLLTDLITEDRNTLLQIQLWQFLDQQLPKLPENQQLPEIWDC